MSGTKGQELASVDPIDLQLPRAVGSRRMTTPKASRRTTRLNPAPKTPTCKRKAATTKTASPSFNEVPNGESEDESGSMGRLRGVSCSQGRRFAGSRWNQVVDFQTEQEILKSGKTNCQPPRRTLDKTQGCRKQGRPPRVDKAASIRTCNQPESSERQRFHERHDLAHNGLTLPDMGLSRTRLGKQQT